MAQETYSSEFTPEPTGEDIASLSLSELLPHYACVAETAVGELSAECGQLCDRLAIPPQGGQTFAERKNRKAKELRHWQLHASLGELHERVQGLFAAAEQLEAGKIDEATAAQLLPQSAAEQDQELPSPTRKAFRRVGDTAWWSIFNNDSLLGTRFDDQRRILTTGNNRKKFVATAPTSALEAEEAFFRRTADTHGGKVRRQPVRTANYYTATSGRRVYKY